MNHTISRNHADIVSYILSKSEFNSLYLNLYNRSKNKALGYIYTIGTCIAVSIQIKFEFELLEDI